MTEYAAPTNFIEEAIDESLKNGVHKKIVTRFPPEPNGYLHIGHAKAICINFGLKQKYGGVCNLRFDDTNPSKEDVEYVNSIQEDIKWLGFTWDNVFFASDYFDKMYECAVLLIKKGLAYVCDLSADEIRETRGTLTEPGTESPYRNRSIEENLRLFEGMKNGEFEEGSRVLRAKIDNGLQQHQHERSGYLPHREGSPSSSGRQMGYLSYVRLRAPYRGRNRRHNAQLLLAGIRGPSSALRLGYPKLRIS